MAARLAISNTKGRQGGAEEAYHASPDQHQQPHNIQTYLGLEKAVEKLVEVEVHVFPVVSSMNHAGESHLGKGLGTGSGCRRTCASHYLDHQMD